MYSWFAIIYENHSYKYSSLFDGTASMHTIIKYIDFIRKHDFTWLKFGIRPSVHAPIKIINGICMHAWILNRKVILKICT